jgi:cystathionine beta-synthase
MKLYDVSQLPVMKDGKIAGLVSEEDILLEVLENPAHFGEPVAQAMQDLLVTVPPQATIDELVKIFDRGLVAIVVDGEEFLGLITRIDLLNWLRRKM